MGWTDKIKSVAGQVKDAGASSAIRAWLSRELADYGEVLDFKLNTRDRSAEFHIQLKGETQPLTVQIDEYDITSEPAGDFVRVNRARASREWVNAVLRNFVLGRRHPIPKQYSGMARLVLNG